jgi:hypothetical protein
MENETKSRYRIQRIGGYLHKIVPIVDDTGRVISQAITPFLVELIPRDIKNNYRRFPGFYECSFE